MGWDGDGEVDGDGVGDGVEDGAHGLALFQFTHIYSVLIHCQHCLCSRSARKRWHVCCLIRRNVPTITPVQDDREDCISRHFE